MFSPEFGLLTNNPALDCPTDRCQALLLDVASRGLIAGKSILVDQSVSPSSESISHALGEWETIAAPNWSKFGRYSSDESEKVIEAATKDVLESTLKYDRFWSGDWPNEETLVVEVLAPWEATYWKRLPSGFRATYQFDQKAPAAEAPPGALRWFRSQHDWHSYPSWSKRE